MTIVKMVFKGNTYDYSRLCQSYCTTYLNNLRADFMMDECSHIDMIDHPDAKIDYHSCWNNESDCVCSTYHSEGGSDGLVAFGRKLVAENISLGLVSPAERYTTVMNSFQRFHGGDVAFDDIDARLMSRYECYLKEHGLCRNTTSYYMRNLRAIYNKAVGMGIIEQRLPFSGVYTGIAKTVKRAVPIEVVRSLKAMDLDSNPASAFARDMFLFSFYTRGMSVVDMAYLRKSDIQNGILSYRRRKTGQRLLIKWEQAIQEIAERYTLPESKFLLPFIRSDVRDWRRQYLNVAHSINYHLKKLGAHLDLTSPLTMYVARHAWASIARENNVPLSIISQGMGHDSEKTTMIYLASLDSSLLDKVNSTLINMVDVIQ